MEGPASIQLGFKPNMRLVSVVRRFVSSFYETMLDDLDLVQRLALATHELLENSTKYGAGAQTRLRIDVELAPSNSATIRTWNETTVSHRDELARRCSELRSCPDQLALYQQLMTDAATRSGGAGLGLARICTEADMALDVEVDGETVCIIATTARRAGRGSTWKRN